MFAVVKPWFERLARSSVGERPTHQAVTITLISLLGASLATEAIGVHVLGTMQTLYSIRYR